MGGLALVRALRLQDHVGAYGGQQREGDPVIDGGDIAAGGHARAPADQGG